MQPVLAASTSLSELNRTRDSGTNVNPVYTTKAATKVSDDRIAAYVNFVLRCIRTQDKELRQITAVITEPGR